MTRPAQVVNQIARAKEIQEEMNSVDNQDPSTNDDPGTPPNTPQEPVVQPPVNNSPVTISKEEYDKLDQRYRTLQGMYTADTNRLRTELGTANDAIQDLEDRLVEVENSTKHQPVTQNKYVTGADVEEFGDNTIDMVRRAAREEAETIAAKQQDAYLKRIAQLESELGSFRNNVMPRVEDLSNSQAEKVKAEYWSALSAQVPDWREINDSKEFKAWLLDEDPVTGANRQQFLASAHKNFDASRVVRFFQEWKRTKAGGQTPAPNSNSQVNLEHMIAPGTSKAGTVPGDAEKKKWTRTEIADFYKDVTTGKYTGRLEEKKKIEAEISSAAREGRVV